MSFKPWPALAPYGTYLDENSPMPGLFYYDVPASTAVADAATLILIHGLGDEADSWRRLIPLLGAAGCRVLALDLPGFGRSAKAGKGNFRRHRDAVFAVLDAAKKQPAPGGFILVGSSMGAIAAEAAAIERPEVKGLVLIDGCIPTGAPLPGPLVAMALPFVGRKWYRAFRNDHQGAFESLFPYYASFMDLDAEDRDFLRARVIDRVTSPTQEASYFSTLRSMLWAWRFKSAKLGKRIAAWPGQISLIWGSEDRIVPKAQAEFFLGIRKDARLHIIEGAGHLPHQEKADACAGIILDLAAS
jgi:pimeloyl-ACP methyl ester carboxylesterase